MWYTLFVILHIISVGVIIGLIVSMIIGTALRKKVAGTPGEIAAMRNGAVMAERMSIIGSNGILITGIVMTLLQYSFFPFSTFPWLAIKQTVFAIILIISFSMLMPNGKRIHKKAEEELSSPNAAHGASDELRKMVNRQYAVAMFVAVLVLINISLGESKAMMWVTGQ